MPIDKFEYPLYFFPSSIFSEVTLDNTILSYVTMLLVSALGDIAIADMNGKYNVCIYSGGNFIFDSAYDNDELSNVFPA